MPWAECTKISSGQLLHVGVDNNITHPALVSLVIRALSTRGTSAGAQVTSDAALAQTDPVLHQGQPAVGTAEGMPSALLMRVYVGNENKLFIKHDMVTHTVQRPPLQNPLTHMSPLPKQLVVLVLPTCGDRKGKEQHGHVACLSGFNVTYLLTMWCEPAKGLNQGQEALDNVFLTGVWWLQLTLHLQLVS